MPYFDFKCNKCQKKFEFNTNKSLPKEFHPPEDNKCPECKEGELEKQFSPQGQSFDIVGYCYENVYGKKNWKKNLSSVEQADVLLGGRDPY